MKLKGVDGVTKAIWSTMAEGTASKAREGLSLPTAGPVIDSGCNVKAPIAANVMSWMCWHDGCVRALLQASKPYQ